MRRVKTVTTLLIIVVMLFIGASVNADSAFWDGKISNDVLSNYCFAVSNSTGTQLTVYYSSNKFRVESNGSVYSDSSYTYMFKDGENDWYIQERDPVGNSLINIGSSAILDKNHATNQIEISSYLDSPFQSLPKYDSNPMVVLATIGDYNLTDSSPLDIENRYINEINGYDKINVFWLPGSQTEYRNIQLFQHTTGWFGIPKRVSLYKGTSYSDTFVIDIKDFNTEDEYELVVSDDTVPWQELDTFTGSSRHYYFKFVTAVKSKLDIIGVNDGGIYSVRPTIDIKKTNNIENYLVRLNGESIYSFTDSPNEAFRLNSQMIDLGENTIVIYKGIDVYKSLTFQYIPSVNGGDGNGGVIEPVEEYQPPKIEESGIERPSVEDPYSKWIYYYLEIIIYYIQLPFVMLANLLKDISVNVMDFAKAFVSTFQSLFDTTKSMFMFLPDIVWSCISFGFALSILLWFVKWRK